MYVGNKMGKIDDLVNQETIAHYASQIDSIPRQHLKYMEESFIGDKKEEFYNSMFKGLATAYEIVRAHEPQSNMSDNIQYHLVFLAKKILDMQMVN